MKPGLLFSAVAWGAMAVTIAGLVAPTVAEAAARPGNERGEDRGYKNRGEQFRARSNERASANASRRDARPAPAVRATAQSRGNERAAPNASRRDARPAPAVRAAAQSRSNERAPNASRRDARPVAAERAQVETRRNWSRGDNERPRAEANRSSGRNWTSARDANDRRSGEARQTDRGDRNTSAWRQDRRDDDRRDTRNDRRDNWRSDSDRNRSTWRDRDNRSDYRDARRWDRNQWRRDNRYNWKRYRDRNRTIYRIGRYYAPYHSYSYRRIGIGFSLGSLFYGSRYWISDPWYYRLPEVYGPYRWVRYYDDVLLVNIYTGEVVDVIHDFFW